MAIDRVRTVFLRLAQVKGYIRCKSKAMKALVGRMMKVRCAHCACCACSGFCAFWRSGSAPTLAPYAGLARLLLQQRMGMGSPFHMPAKSSPQPFHASPTQLHTMRAPLARSPRWLPQAYFHPEKLLTDA